MIDQRHRVRDPIHGFIDLSPLEIRIVNTRVFQRLRRIKQLALAYLVYPGAQHTRFEHSLGTRYIAGRICDELNKKSGADKVSAEEREAICAAALLHDIGHGPFSHVSEYLLERYRDRALPAREKIHELIGRDIIKDDPELKAILGQKLQDRILELLFEPDKREFARYIISSDFDADKLDYLLRDAYYCGVKYGIFDIEKLIEECGIHQDREESLLALGHEAIFAFEQMLLAKYHMHRQVYSHRIRRITDRMLVRSLSLAVGSGRHPEIKKLYEYKNTPDFLQHYLDYYDEKVMRCLLQSADDDVKGYAERLFSRRLFKLLYTLTIDESQVGSSSRRRELLSMASESPLLNEMEKKIAERLRLKQCEVILSRSSIKNPAYEAPGWDIDAEKILFLTEKCEDKTLAEFSDELLISTSKEHGAAETLEVYGPKDHWNEIDGKQREREENETRDTIQAIILGGE